MDVSQSRTTSLHFDDDEGRLLGSILHKLAKPGAGLSRPQFTPDEQDLLKELNTLFNPEDHAPPAPTA